MIERSMAPLLGIFLFMNAGCETESAKSGDELLSSQLVDTNQPADAEQAAPQAAEATNEEDVAQQDDEEDVAEGGDPWSGQPVVVVGNGRYHAVQDYEETAQLLFLDIRNGRITFDFDPSPPWPDYKVSGWRAQGSLCVMRSVNGEWRKYWGDYFERDHYNRAVDELNHHMGDGRPQSGETVWICACDGDRAREGTQRTNWVAVQWP